MNFVIAVSLAMVIANGLMGSHYEKKLDLYTSQVCYAQAIVWSVMLLVFVFAKIVQISSF